MSYETTTLALAITGNTLNLAYNIPFVYEVVKNKSAENISTFFLVLRIFGSLSWMAYAIVVDDVWILISYIFTITSTLIISFVKICEFKNKTRNLDTNYSIKCTMV